MVKQETHLVTERADSEILQRKAEPPSLIIVVHFNPDQCWRRAWSHDCKWRTTVMRGSLRTEDLGVG